jgi:serine/threonine-protein kinase RsbW
MEAVDGKADDALGPFAVVRVQLESRPEAVTLVRSMLAGISEFMQLDAELQDDLKTAVSEACNNVVLHAYEGEPGPMWFELKAGPKRIEVLVRDEGVGIRRVSPAEDRMGVGLAVISALAARAEFQSSPDAGTEVRMEFTGIEGANRDGGHFELSASGALVAHPSWALPAGDLEVWLAPVELLPQVLGRLVRGLAAAAHFPVDRFAALHRLTSAISERAADRAQDIADVGFVLSAAPRRLELAVAPLPARSGEELFGGPAVPADLEPLLERLTTAPVGGEERLEVVLIEPRR